MHYRYASAPLVVMTLACACSAPSSDRSLPSSLTSPSDLRLAAANASREPHGTGPTATPIRHVVIIFDENRSFDHYFGTYPHAENLPGEPPFHARPETPSVNGLSSTLLTHNPNLVQPFRFSPGASEDVRPEPQLRSRAARLRPWPHGQVRPGRRYHRARLRSWVRHGPLRRQHRDSPVELRAALRHERQFLRHDLRAIDGRRDQPRVAGRRTACSLPTWSSRRAR